MLPSKREDLENSRFRTYKAQAPCNSTLNSLKSKKHHRTMTFDHQAIIFGEDPVEVASVKLARLNNTKQSRL